MSPMVFDADMKGVRTAFGEFSGFSLLRFASTCASYIRSGYTVLLVGSLIQGGRSDRHLVCAVGYRPSESYDIIDTGTVQLAESTISYMYVHDDNVGPAMRCRLREHERNGLVVLVPEGPQPRHRSTDLRDPTNQYFPFVPDTCIVALPDEIRVSGDTLHKEGLSIAGWLSDMIRHQCVASMPDVEGLACGWQLFRIRDYMGDELQRLIGTSPSLLSKVRLSLSEQVAPMSLYIGVVRIRWSGQIVLDVLLDTTGTSSRTYAFAFVVLEQVFVNLVETLSETLGASRAGAVVMGFAD